MTSRILLVDDESAILFAYHKVLQSKEIVVDAVESKEDTLQLLKKHNYSAAILDLRLGGGSDSEEGFELLEHIKEKFPQTTTLIITAYGNQDIKEKAYKLGVNYYFEKPVSMKIIQRALKDSGLPIPTDSMSRVDMKIQ